MQYAIKNRRLIKQVREIYEMLVLLKFFFEFAEENTIKIK